MKFAIQETSTKNKKQDCIIIGIFEGGELTPTGKKLDSASKGAITKLLKHGDIQGKLEETQFFYQLPNLDADRIMLIGCGKSSEINEQKYRKIITSSLKVLISSKVKHAFSFLTEVPVINRDSAWKIKQAIEVSNETGYIFNTYKSKKSPTDRLLETLTYAIPERSNVKACQTAYEQAIATAEAVEFTKNLANQPSNVCTPTYLSKEAEKLAKHYRSLKVKVLNEKEMRKLGMNALLAVAKGSEQEPKLICLEYKGGSKKPPIAFVGKGITFDTGGISLKQPEFMVGMKYDMCGAATVLGVMKAAADLKLPLNLVGIIATAENMPSGSACKPEDIVTTLSGQTVEILNTDAEGRLVLCDALTYCERYKPETVIDIATLTGAVVMALGLHATGLLSNYEPLAKELLAAGNESFDRAWQFPLWEEYQEQLNSPFADMSNTGGRMAGVITAACFLSRFTKKVHWAHLDIAGTAAMMIGSTERFATGRPVPMLVQYLINRCDKPKS